MNNKLPPLWLVVGLMMFPQIVETIYSPALTQIATQFRVGIPDPVGLFSGVCRGCGLLGQAL